MQSAEQLIEVRLARADRPDKHGRLAAAAGGDRDRFFVDVQTDKQWSRLRHG
jgi:hypothetical protein